MPEEKSDHETLDERLDKLESQFGNMSDEVTRLMVAMEEAVKESRESKEAMQIASKKCDEIMDLLKSRGGVRK